MATATDATRATLLDAALRLHAAGDGQAIRMEDIAVAAGVSRATLYYHFRSREALLDALVQRGIGEFAEAVTSAIADALPPEAVIGAAVRRLALQAPLIVVVLGEIGSLPGQAANLATRLEAAVIAPFGAYLARCIEAGTIRPCDPQLCAAALIGQVESVLGAAFALGRTPDPAHVEAELVALTRAALASGR